MREQTPIVRLLQDIFDLVAGAFGHNYRPVSAVELAPRMHAPITFTASEMKP